MVNKFPNNPQDDQNQVYLATKRYSENEWDPDPISLFEKPVPVGVYPARHPPEWVHSAGKKKGEVYAGYQMLDPAKWSAHLDKQCSGILRNGQASHQFYADLAQNILDRILPEFLVPDDPTGPSQFEKLLTFMQSQEQNNNINPIYDVIPDHLNTRDEEEYDVPYGGRAIGKEAREASRNCKYYPTVGDNVFVFLEGNEGEVYNAKGIPEPAIVTLVDVENELVQVGNFTKL